jgi:hypothetical protein
MKNFDELKFRQVHLDFHTSGHIENIGAEFDEEQFIKCLKLGHLNSITVFALCHHGYCYYETEKGTKHPHLKIDLLPAILKACEKAGVDAPVYITVGWNELIGIEHPEWVVRGKDGTLYNNQNLDKNASPDDPRPWGWDRICVNTPYLDYLLGITREVMEKFNPVEIFYDITGENECYCDTCMKSMKEKGIDADNPEEVKKYGTEIYLNSLKKFTELIWGMNPKTKVYHNAGDRKGRYDLYQYFSHYEIESLPTGQWGYGHFPHNAKYFSMTDMDFLGMTGKFHTAWGEFGGYKNPDALRYECGRIIAYGGKCSVGDQMPPSGLMDEETYRIIGEAYKHVEEREEWCSGLKSIADIGVLCPSAVAKDHSYDTSDMGAALVLTELQMLFDMIDETMPFDKYKVMILPDHVLINEDLKKKLEDYLSKGGKLLLTGESGLDLDRKNFQLDMGLEYAGKSEWDIDYTLAKDSLPGNTLKSAYLNYESGTKTKVCGAEVLATTISPYFNRTYKHFCSHRYTPPSGKDAGYPSVTQKGSIVYMAHNIFNIYQEMGAKVHRDMIRNCLSLLLSEKTLDIPLPSCGTIALYKREKENDYIFHALYANPIKRGEVQVIEDIVPLYKIPVKVKTAEKIKAVKLLPSGEEIPFKEENGQVSFEISKLDMHAMFQIIPE